MSRRMLLAFVVSLLLASACGGSDSGELIPADAPSLDSFEVVGWPEGITDEVPPLPGTVTLVMGGDQRTRIFYDGVTEDAVGAYLKELSDRGYSMEFIVFESPGETADPKPGEWDRLRATKGEITIGLEYGQGTGTLDLDGLP